MNAYLALGASIVIGVFGQLALKAGAAQSGANLEFTYLNPYVLGGLFFYFFAALLYIYSLKTIPLSAAFPSVSISYVIVALVAHFLWKEAFGVYQILALVLICSGVYLLYAS